MSQLKVISVGGLPIRNLTLDIPTISKFCLSVGMARAMAQTSNLEWQRTELSGLLKLLYMAMPWKEPPGNAVFTVPERDKLYELARGYAAHWQAKAIERLAQDPKRGFEYLKNLEEIRRSHLETVLMRARAAVQINQYVDELLTSAIKAWSTVKLVGTVGVACVGLAAGIAGVAGLTVVGTGSLQIALGAPSLAFTGVSVGFNLLLTNIPSWDGVHTAQCVSVALGQAGLSKGADKGVQSALDRVAKTEALIREAELKIEEVSKRLGNDWNKTAIEFSKTRDPTTGNLKQWVYSEEWGVKQGAWCKEVHVDSIRAEVKKEVTSYTKELSSHKQAVNFWKGVGVTLQVIFFAWDVWQAIQTYMRDLKAAAN
jgi:hypothetical protein